MARRKPRAGGKKPANAANIAVASANARPATAANARLPWLDALRGGAVLAMIAYHFGYDLNFLGWLHQDINHDQRWMAARTLILGTFLLTVGASLALRWRRIGKIAAAAALVSAGSWLLFPQSAIWFGTLHAIAVMSLILLLLPLGALRSPAPAALSIILGLGALALGNTYANALFDQPALAWIGLMTYKPLTEDYVPLLPWFGVCLIGYGAMQALLRKGLMQRPQPGRNLPALLFWTGRHSLAIYLLHQPILLGVLIPATHWLKPA